jgi:hypothetical protein
MAELLERIKLSLLVHGNGLAENYKNNTLFFLDKYSKSDEEVTSIKVPEIQLGRFYHFHCVDQSNWIQYSPVFTVDFRKMGSFIMIIALNFNFIPLEVRSAIFDKFIKEQDFENDNALAVSFQGVYKELSKWGFEYALVEYNAKQIALAHKINLSVLPRFINSGHPKNKYDPAKLFEIWEAKIEGRHARNEEMSRLLMTDFLKSEEEIIENYKVLKEHVFRVKKRIFKNLGK